MSQKHFVVACFVLLFLAGCTTGNLGGPATMSYESGGATLQNTIETYQKLEPRLTAAQREKFKEAYEGICRSYQTAGVLLSSVTDAADEASAHTAMFSYQRTIGELPNMINRLARLVQGFKR